MGISVYTLLYVVVVYSWHRERARENERKHGISFEQASQVFEDPRRVVEASYQYTDDPRFQAIGTTRHGQIILVVVFVERTRTNEDSEKIVLRLIAARKATPYESQHYLDAKKT